MGGNIYMLPSNINLKIKTGTVGYNNKILVSDGKFSLWKNEEVNAFESFPHTPNKTVAQPKIIHKVVAQPPHAHELSQKPTITHEEEKLLWYFSGRWSCNMEYVLVKANLSLQ